MKDHKHIIHKEILRLKTSDSSSSLQWQQLISHLLNTELRERMDELFTGIAGESEQIRIDRIQLDLGIIQADELKHKFAEVLMQKLLQQLAGYVNTDQQNMLGRTNSASMQAQENMKIRSQWKSFLLFLGTGRLPWRCIPQNFEIWESEILSIISQNKCWLPEFILTIQQNKRAVRRLAFQFSVEFNLNLLPQLYPGWTDWHRSVDDLKNAIEDQDVKGNPKGQDWRQIILLAMNKISSGKSHEFPQALMETLQQNLSTEQFKISGKKNKSMEAAAIEKTVNKNLVKLVH
jgi:hypothetical protein